MKILLINPNRYRTPPVPPLGLEYLENALRYSRHECRICDLCFADDTVAALDNDIEHYSPDIAGMTIRNTDTVIYQNNLFFLDDIKLLVDCLKERNIPVILGGAGYSFIPEGILAYLGADLGIAGPGERMLVDVLDLYENKPPPAGTVFDGWERGYDPDIQVERGGSIDYARYLSEGGLLGFETQKGCVERCSYCSEGVGRVIFRNPDSIVQELHTLAERGFNDYHLCDTEFNQDLSFCRAFLERLIGGGPEINWALYIKSSPYDDDLFRLIKKSGASLITLSIPTGKNSLEHAAEITRLAKKHSIRLAVDLLCGFPGETSDSVKQTIEFLRKISPDTVGVNSTIRLYPNTSLAEAALKSRKYSKNLLGNIDNNPYLIRPVFYNHIGVGILREIIGEDPLFKIEGFERTSNYERIRQAEVRGE